jgi:hypothetical protein
MVCDNACENADNHNMLEVAVVVACSDNHNNLDDNPNLVRNNQLHYCSPLLNSVQKLMRLQLLEKI